MVGTLVAVLELMASAEAGESIGEVSCRPSGMKVEIMDGAERTVSAEMCCHGHRCERQGEAEAVPAEAFPRQRTPQRNQGSQVYAESEYALVQVAITVLGLRWPSRPTMRLLDSTDIFTAWVL